MKWRAWTYKDNRKDVTQNVGWYLFNEETRGNYFYAGIYIFTSLSLGLDWVTELLEQFLLTLDSFATWPKDRENHHLSESHMFHTIKKSYLLWELTRCLARDAVCSETQMTIWWLRTTDRDLGAWLVKALVSLSSLPTACRSWFCGWVFEGRSIDSF